MRIGIGLVIIMAAASASAQKPRIAVMPVDVDASAKKEVPDLIDDIALTAVQDAGNFEVIGQDDINALLGLEQQKELLGCDDSTCIAELGGALGVERLVVMKIARLGGDWALTGKVINIAQARVESRSSEFVGGGARELLTQVPGFLQRLLAKLAEETPSSSGSASTSSSSSSSDSTSSDTARDDGAKSTTAEAKGEVSDTDKRMGLAVGAMLGFGVGGNFFVEGATGSASMDPGAVVMLNVDWWLSRWFAVGAGFEFASTQATGGNGRQSWEGLFAQATLGIPVGIVSILVRGGLGVTFLQPPGGTGGFDVNPGVYFGLWPGIAFHIHRHVDLTALTGMVLNNASLSGFGTTVNFFLLDWRTVVGAQFRL